MKPELVNSKYQMIWNENFETMCDYNKLLNWTNEEFILCQRQEEVNGLKVFFPNGWFFIKLIEKNRIGFEIIVKSKCKKTIVKTYNHIVSMVKHFKKYKVIISKEDS